MAWEIERKFLVDPTVWQAPAGGARLCQGYLSLDRGRVVRVRVEQESATLTIKGQADGPTRPEFEYEIPLADGRALLDLCAQPLIEKTRYRIVHGRDLWEVDVFHGANDGLLVAECELETADQVLELPVWVGREVTDDFRYANSSLVKHPYSSWS